MTTAAQPVARTGTGATSSASLRFYRRIFSDSPERSIRVRGVVLLASLWAAATLILAGASLVVPLVVMPVFVVGHIVAYRAINRRIPALPLVIALIIIVVGVAMRHELVMAVRGERIPVAHFLLIAGSASVFEARTRAGLYTQLLFSSLIMFFASELAFGNEFAAPLGGYLALIVAFLAISQYVDVTRGASVARRGGAAGAAAFWAGVGILVGISSLIAFLLLPWDASQAPDAARFAILPVNGAGEGAESPISPEQAQDLLEQATHQLAGGDPRQGGTGTNAGDITAFANLLGDPTIGAAGSVSAGQGGAISARPSGSALAPPELDEGTVAFIRSAVASYWRGAVYDSFDPGAEGVGGEWLTTLPERRRLGSLFARPDGTDEADRYLQTFFLQQGLGSQFVTGYEPFSIAISKDERGLPVAENGATYQVVSGRPVITADELRQDRAGWAASEYDSLPSGYGEVYALARALTAGAETDFDRAVTIAAYLNGLDYDPESTSPLESNADLADFVFGRRPGSAIDFATAQALMSRAVGLQSRVATGFLPGSYNPYSGAAEVRDSDLHAWAEVLFNEAGWVPFDASSRPDLPNPSSIESPPPSGFSSILDRRLGDNLASALNSSPSGLSALFRWLLKIGPAFGISIMLLTAIAGFAYWWYRLRRRTPSDGDIFELMSYSALTGPDREQRATVLRAFSKLERRIAKAGFRRRRSDEPIGEFARKASIYMTEGSDGLLQAAGMAERAAYSTNRLSSEEAEQAARQMKNLRLRTVGAS